MSDEEREKFLDDLATVFAHAAVDRFIAGHMREWFAGCALQGLLASRGTFGGVETSALEIADNMVAALKP